VLGLVDCSLLTVRPRPAPSPPASPVEREFAAAAITWDLNRDGNVTCDEWTQYATDLFRAADAHHDGALTRDEFASLSLQDKLFEVHGFGYYGNGDGLATLSEVIDNPNPAFALLDANHDRVITSDERCGTDSKSSARRNRGSS
jgi:hypothetical protein